MQLYFKYHQECTACFHHPHAFLNAGDTADNYLSLTCRFSFPVVSSHIPYINNITCGPSRDRSSSLCSYLCVSHPRKKKITQLKQALNLQYRAVLRGCLHACICHHYPWTESLSASESFQLHHYQLEGSSGGLHRLAAHATHRSHGDVAAQALGSVDRKQALHGSFLSERRGTLLVQ